MVSDDRSFIFYENVWSGSLTVASKCTFKVRPKMPRIYRVRSSKTRQRLEPLEQQLQVWVCGETLYGTANSFSELQFDQIASSKCDKMLFIKPIQLFSVRS